MKRKRHVKGPTKVPRGYFASRMALSTMTVGPTKKVRRSKNPRMQNMFVLLALRGKEVLKYVGGVRFSSKGRAVLFPTRQAANATARELRSRFPILNKYRLTVQS